ncbi:autotransporter domain-containing protein [Cetobacterium sp.]|uniref:autotransporter domain-containing protein n=1 Tax=Cetobacterium sp. TaxID=2071632 RepID=UPI002FC8E9D1
MRNIEKNFKRWIKNRVGFTLGVLISFLITGGIGYSKEIVNNEEIVIGSYETALSSTGIGNSVINNGTIIGKGVSLTGINVNDGAKAINEENAKINIEMFEQNSTTWSNQGISASNSFVENFGEITVKGSQNQGGNTFGIVGWDSSSVLNGKTGNINISGYSATGINLGLNSFLVNYGKIKVDTTLGWGISISGETTNEGKPVLGNGSLGENYGEIIVMGVNNTGLNVFSDSELLNHKESKILVDGENSTGIRAYDVSRVINEGNIEVRGDRSSAISILGESELLNEGNIETFGTGSLGIKISGESKGYNEGRVITHGISAMGALVMDKSIFLNTGYIEVNGDAYSNQNVNSGIDIQGTAKGMNNGVIKTTGRTAFGMRSNGIAINGKEGEIITTGLSGVGMYSRIDRDTDEGIALNYGKIKTEGKDATGMKSDRGTIINYETGLIETAGENARGLVGYSGAKVENYGTISTTGARGRGIHLNGETSIGINHKTGVIKTLGEKAYGMRSFNGATIENHGTIITGDKKDSSKGNKAYGMHAFRTIALGKVSSDEVVLENIIYDYKDVSESKNARVSNTGTIETYGDFTHGMSIVAGNNATNNGNITTNGKEASGIAIDYSGMAENFGKVQTTGLEAKGVKVISKNYIVDEIEYEVNKEERTKKLISKNSDRAIFTNHKDGKIITKGDKAYGVYLDSYIADRETIEKAKELGVILKDTDVKKAEFTNNGTIDTHGDDAYGIYSSNSLVNNNGNIHTRGKGAYGIYAINSSEVNHSGEIHVNDPNAYGIVYDSTSKINISKNAIIKVNGKSSNAIMMLDGLNRKYLETKSVINNYGQIGVDASESKGIIVAGVGTAINSGYIDINGINSVGMYASGAGATIDNQGTIALNLADKSIAMVGLEGAIVKNSGTLKLKDYQEESLGETKFNELLKVDSKSSLLNSGIVVNAQDKVVVSAGEEILDQIENIGKDDIFKGQNTVVITGEKLEGILNQGENFIEEDGKYLLKVPTSKDELMISGTINAGKNGVEIEEGTKVNLIGSINTLGNAIYMSGAKLNSNGANIVGNIILKNDNEVTLSKTQLDGDILGLSGSNTEISLENSTSIKGNILLGSGDDRLTIDSSTGNLLQESTVIDGGDGNDSLILGSKNEMTIVKANIKNFQENNFLGKVFLDSKAKILSESSEGKTYINNTNTGDIKIGEGSYLVLGVSSNGEHSLDSISGNTITADKNGKLVVQSDMLSLDKNGKYQLDLVGTKLNLENENILASQFIYEVYKTISGNLELSMKSLLDMGIDGKYQDIYNSILSSGNLSGLKSTLLGNEKELESILNQISYKNPYALSMKSSRDSLVAWNEGIKLLKEMPEKGEWLVTGSGVGNYYESNNTTGLLATGEYGIASKTSLGISFGGGKQNVKVEDNPSKIESDTFYIGAVAKKNIEKYRILGAIGYQKNTVDSTRILSNRVESFRFDESYDIDALNILIQGTYEERISEKVSIEPKVSLNYSYISQEGIDEGNKAMAMKVDKTNLNVFEGSVGVDFVRKLDGYKGYKGEVYLGTSYSYLGGDTDKDLVGSIGSGSEFKIKAVKMNESKGILTLGTNIQNSKGYSYGVELNYEVGNERSGSQVVASLGYKF